MNLLSIPWIRAVLRSRFYPAGFQWLTAAAFVVILFSALFGPNNSGQNFGMALAWTVWWPLLPLSFLLVGRFWCAICPFAWLMDRAQNAVGVRFKAPRFLRRHEPWIIAALFVLVTYVDEAWQLQSDARLTGYLLLAVLAAAIFFASYFERRTFCRYVCFISGFAANYSRAGILQLRTDPDRCGDCRTQDCYEGTKRTKGCPVFLFAPGIADSATCHLCGNCVKNCPRDAIRISLRGMTAELCDISQPRLAYALLAGIVMGVVLIEQVALLRLWNPLLEATGGLLHLDPYAWYPLVYGVLLAAFMAAPLIGLALAGLLSEALDGAVRHAEVLQNIATFGYAIIPLALAGHVAYGLYHLLTRSRTVPFAFLALVGRFPSGNHPQWLMRSTVFQVEIAVLVLGAAGSLYVAYRLQRARARRSPWTAFFSHGLLLLALLAANLYAVFTMLREIR
jgi:NAD-dependent dihydropyrimidine dehydrogenase PreA subunit